MWASMSSWGTERQVPCHPGSICAPGPCLLARRLLKPCREAKPRSDGEVIGWRRDMDRLSRSRTVCHYSLPRPVLKAEEHDDGDPVQVLLSLRAHVTGSSTEAGQCRGGFWQARAEG